VPRVGLFRCRPEGFLTLLFEVFVDTQAANAMAGDITSTKAHTIVDSFTSYWSAGTATRGLGGLTSLEGKISVVESRGVGWCETISGDRITV